MSECCYVFKRDTKALVGVAHQLQRCHGAEKVAGPISGQDTRPGCGLTFIPGWGTYKKATNDVSL